jgi:hypothetical protein
MGSCQVTLTGPTNVTATFLRANVGLSISPAPAPLLNGDRILAATLTARAGCGPIDHIQFGTFGAPFQNARVAVTSPAGGLAGQLLGFTYTPPPSTTAVTITIERVVPSGEGMVNPIYFYDGCGEWRTFVGGGPEAFR